MKTFSFPPIQITLAGILLFCTSCSDVIYTIKNKKQVAHDIGYPSGKLPFHMPSNDLYAPFLKEKGDVYLNGSFGNAFGGAAAVAVSDKMFITTHISHYYKSQNEPSGTTYIEADYHYVDYNNVTIYGDTADDFVYTKDLELTANDYNFGFGWYKNYKMNFMNEISTGVGFGKIKNDYNYVIWNTPNQFSEKRKYYQLYLQDDIGYVRDYFEAGFTGRLNTYFFSDRTIEMTQYLEVPGYQSYAFSLEGSFRIAAGWKYFKPFLEVTGTVPLASPEIKSMPVSVKGGIITRF